MGVLPSSVLIDAITYQVKVVDADEMLQATRRDSCLGYVLHTENAIYILDTLAPSAQEAALMHEVIHALDCNHDLDLSESDVRTLGVAIPAFLKANGFWHNAHMANITAAPYDTENPVAVVANCGESWSLPSDFWASDTRIHESRMGPFITKTFRREARHGNAKR